MLTEEEKILKSESLFYIKTFIEEMGGFYPFAMIMDKQGVVSSLAPEEANLDVQSLIDLYTRTLKYETSKIDAIYEIGILSVDVAISQATERGDTKENGIEMAFVSKGEKTKSINIIYRNRDNGEIYFVDDEVNNI